ncbi:unnamed protein product [Calypogeia fissa]
MGSPPLEPLFTNVILSTVEPLEKMAHVESIDPTDFDRAALDHYAPALFAYRLAENSDAVYVQAVSRIKEGLYKCWFRSSLGQADGLQPLEACAPAAV